MSRLGSSLLWGMPVLSIDELVEQIDAVGAEDCSALARELLAGPRLSVAGIGPDEDVFRNALAPLEQLAASSAANGAGTIRREPEPVP